MTKTRSPSSMFDVQCSSSSSTSVMTSLELVKRLTLSSSSMEDGRIFQQFIGKFEDERELSATTSQSCGQGKAQDMVEELKIKEVKIIS